ncbi:uncharacterized protein DS421_11g338640 [Arachis hypogaea]|nr:uncharacterized protein DS421_11g338640 [Arachis hypogaea]
MAHSSTSPSTSKKIQTVHFRAILQTAEIELVAKIRTLHQHNIELSINNLQKNEDIILKVILFFLVVLGVTVLVVLVLLQIKDLKCATHLLSKKFRNMSEEKKIIIRDLEFGGLMHIPLLRVHHQILRELANSFKLGENRLETGYGSFKVRQKTIGAALGINTSGDLFPQKVNYKDLSEDDKQIFRRFQGKTLKNLTDEMMAIGVDNEQDRLMFKRIFILYIQMAFLLPTTINKISHVHLAPIFEMDTITERNWGGHVLSFIIKGITNYKLKKKKAIDGCLFALMIIYFHLSKNKDKKRAERPPEPWIANWSKEQLVERMRAEMEEHMSENEEDSEDSPRKQPSQKVKKMESKKRKKNQENSDSESESTDESKESSPMEKQKTKKKTQRILKKTQSKKKKVIVEDSSPDQAQSYHGTEDLDEFLRENNEKFAAEGEKEANLRLTEGHYVSSEMLSLVEESASESAEENMMVVREETPSEGLAIVSIQVCLPLSQTTTMPKIEQTPETENEPTPVLQIEGTTKSNLVLEDAAALMMMARTASYVPKTDLMPSFSLGLTDSSQEEAAMQEGASTQDGGRAKTPEISKLLEQLGDLTYANGLTNEFDTVCTLQAQDRYTLSKLHLASLAPEMHIEVEIVSAMCFILNQQKIKSFQEEVYCLLPDIVYMLGGTSEIKGQGQGNCTTIPSHLRPKDKHDVDRFRVEYASRILFHDMNLDKAEAIRGSNAIRLSKPSSLLLSPYCQIDSKDIDTD